MLQRQKQSLITLYLAYFSDYFCWGAAIAFLASYINTEASSFKNIFWDPEISLWVAYAAFPIGEVIGSPIFGDLSDWIGRKKVLIWGFWGSILSMALCGLALWIGDFGLFLFGQLLVGFFSGKQSMAQAAIVEIHAGTKAQKLAFLSVLGGIAWVLGPFFGSHLMKEPFTNYGGYIWPYILACLVYFITLICTDWFFYDIYEPSVRPFSKRQFLKSVGSLFGLIAKERIFFIFLLNLMGWYLLVVSLSDLLINKFHLTDAEIGIYNSYFGICFSLGGVVGTAWILRRWKAKNVLFWSLLAGSLGLFLLFGADRVIELWTYLAIPTFTEAWIYPAYQTVLSDQTNERNQGKIFGIIGATSGACQFIAFLILGKITNTYAVLIAAILFLVSAALVPSIGRKKKGALA